MAQKRAIARTDNSVPAETVEDIYTVMRRIRAFEEKVLELYKAGTIKGTAHSYAGEEAIAAGIAPLLRAEDYVGSYHRGHGHCIAKGASTARMMAELMGRKTGYCSGFGGSLHVADMGLNIMGANGIVGAAMPLCAGAALAIKLRGGDGVAVAFFGDGAANQGVFHETMNLAAVWNLPLLFICENNSWALNTAIERTTAGGPISGRAKAYGIPGVTVDGNDGVAVYQAAREAVARARAGGGPSLIEAMTWRHTQHSLRVSVPDPRSAASMDEWHARDPLDRFRKIADGTPLAARFAAVDASIDEELAEAVAFAEASPEPSYEDMMAAVNVPHTADVEPGPQSSRTLSYAEALTEAMDQEMARDSSVFIMGEDVGETGGIFQITKGLYQKFGDARVRDTPISEAAFSGAGVGAAISGMRPIIEMQFVDFATQMVDMICNQAAKFRFMLGGGPTVPIVFRGPQGGGIRLAAQHSQSLEAWYAHIPGLVVIAPSTAYDAKGLLIAAIRDDNPVIFLEHKMLYLGQSGPVPEQPYAIPIGKASIVRPGRDVTIVATQLMVSRAVAAARVLEREGISVEIIDPRTIRPLDEETILESVKRTNRLVIVHEAHQFLGFGAEVSAMVTEKAFDFLDAPILRVAAPEVPMPFNDTLERMVMPSQQRIEDAVRSLWLRA